MYRAVTISIGTSHTPTSRETNAAWLLRLREDCTRLAAAEIIHRTADREPGIGADDVLISPAESSGG
jgi:hypothetical protein